MPPCLYSSIQNSPLPPALQAFSFSDILSPYASVAQLVEQVTLNHLVLGSSPSRGNFQRFASPGLSSPAKIRATTTNPK